MLDLADMERPHPLPLPLAGTSPEGGKSTYLRLQVQVRSVPGPAGIPVARPGYDRNGRSGLSANLVRRCLGKALIDALCPFGEPRCQPAPVRGISSPSPDAACDLARSCAYGVLYASSSTRRPPFAIHVPRLRDHQLIELTLYGPGCRYYPWLLRALKNALTDGLGKARARWRIGQVWRVPMQGRGEKLCGSDFSSLAPALRMEQLQLAAGEYAAPQPVEVRLLSPARLIQDGKLIPGRAPVPFEILIARVLDRFQGLYGDGGSRVLQPEVREALEAAAAQVPLVVNDTRWVEVYDYSARQRKELRFGGKVGRLVYGEGAARFMPILRAGEILHVGKNPTSGCGRIGVRGRMR